MSDERINYDKTITALLAHHPVCTLVTPEMAQHWLDTATFKNRRIQAKHVRKLTRRIETGRWKPNHQGIAFTPDGSCCDGQHRLLAIVAAGIAVPLWLFYNVDEDSVSSVDRGRLRTTDQDLQMQGVNRASERVALMRANLELMGFDSTLLYDSDEYKRWEPLFGEGIDFILAYSRRVMGTARTAPVLGAIAFAYPLNRSRTKLFADRFSSGVGLQAGDPELALQRLVQDPRNRCRGQQARARLGRATCMCMRAALLEHKIMQLRIVMTGVEWIRLYYQKHYPDLLLENRAGMLAFRSTSRKRNRDECCDDDEDDESGRHLLLRDRA